MSLAQPAVGTGATPLGSLQTASVYQPSLKELVASWEKNFYSNITKFIIVSAIQIVIVIWVISGGGIAEVVNNWPKYRCNPMIMPFASLFGYDASENFNFCMKNIFSMNAGAVLAPVYGVMSNFTDIIGTISNVANSFRYLISNLLHGMERLMSSFRDRFQFILFSIRMSFFKIMNLMGRLYTTFYAVIFMGMSALQAAQNVANNDMVKFLLEFCFDPETPIELASGLIIPLKQVAIGDELAAINGVVPIVTSKFKFDGLATPMVNLNNTVVSSKHYVYYEKLASWIKAEDHPDALVVSSLPYLDCLNTSNHKILINNTIFADYDESESPEVIKATQKLAEQCLNSGVSGPVSSDYALGLDGNTQIKMDDGSFKELRHISIGDVIGQGGAVLGLVQEQINNICILENGIKVSAAQLVWQTDKWVRAGSKYDVTKLDKAIVFYQLITELNIIVTKCGVVFRDYREVNVPEMESAYERELKGMF